ncbi:MAG: type IV pilin N-terminal domain-containing protein [Nitrososphaerota archaeon]|jgi:flagellin-like protein|nr:type IV pilin N-terminal domain-containing protein [Nitrososphaerota archaeon]MDG6919930.1 type IV pilin N-terminal domain-containing protein [Nitrososphaerota archaeon]
MKISGRQRKGISPIIATVLIIAATLIAFAAVAGYIFGLFGSSTKSAQAQVVGSSLVASTGDLTLTFSNSGGQSVTVSSVSVTVGSTTYTETPGGTTFTASAIPPAVTTVITVDAGSGTGQWTSSTFTAGTTYTFSIVLSNGITSTISVTAS